MRVRVSVGFDWAAASMHISLSSSLARAPYIFARGLTAAVAQCHTRTALPRQAGARGWFLANASSRPMFGCYPASGPRYICSGHKASQQMPLIAVHKDRQHRGIGPGVFFRLSLVPESIPLSLTRLGTPPSRYTATVTVLSRHIKGRSEAFTVHDGMRPV